MIEVYRNDIDKLVHQVYVGDELTEADGSVEYVVRSRITGDVVDFGTASEQGESPDNVWYEVIVGPSVTAAEDEYDLEWSYSVSGVNVTKLERLYVVTPYVTMQTLRKNKKLDIYTNEQLRSQERVVAEIIDAFCNQSFNFEPETSKTAFGKDSDFLWLPKRLVALSSVEVLDRPVRIEQDEIVGEGPPLDITNRVVLDEDNRWRIRRRRGVRETGLDPLYDRSLFKEGAVYQVTGDWGYRGVPREVSKAAEILVDRYFADDSKYRDVYINNIRAGNWRMEFKLTGDETTGSANADMMLSGHRSLNAVII